MSVERKRIKLPLFDYFCAFLVEGVTGDQSASYVVVVFDLEVAEDDDEDDECDDTDGECDADADYGTQRRGHCVHWSTAQTYYIAQIRVHNN